MSNIYKANFLVVFAAYLFSFLLLNYIEQTYIITDERILASFSERPDINKIEAILEATQEVSVLESAFFIAKFIAGFYLVVVSFYTSALVSELKVSFQSLSKIILVAYGSFLAAYLVKILWFLSLSEFTLKEFDSFYPLSLMNFFDYSGIDYWMKYPLQYINAFQVLFIFLVSIGMTNFLEVKLFKSLVWSSVTYLVILVFWIVLISFFLISFS